MMKINLVMIVKNEERSLRRCLEAAKPLVDRMIVVDTGSEDETVKIAEEMGAAVLKFSWVDDFSAARNFALEHSDGDWNLVLDADEYIRPISRETLEDAILSQQGKWLGGILRYDSYKDDEGISVSTSILPRLLPGNVRYIGRIHEQPAGNYPCMLLPMEVDHDGYLYMDKGERNLPYLRLAVEEEPQDGYYQFQLASTLRNLKRYQESLPYFQNFYQYVKPKEAYRGQGIVLYLYTLLDLGREEDLDMAAKIIEQEEENLYDWPDFYFVCGIFYMKRVLSNVEKYIALLPNIERCYLRCLELGERPKAGSVMGTGSFKAAYNLGTWYEVSGQKKLAVKYYQMSLKEGYVPAAGRLKALT